MSLIVQKYGGSSLADAASIRRVARRIVNTRMAGNDVCVVVSAMGDTTDELLDLADEVTEHATKDAPSRELDMLLTTGERISMSLVSMAINKLGYSARSYTGSQAGVITDATHGSAHILDVTPGRIQSALASGHIVIVAGFQGVSATSKEITTLGRGGSDTTAVALAAALKADVCEIYTDVDGVFSADPRIVPTARKLSRITNEEMQELAACGTKVLMHRCVEYARRFNTPLHVRSSFSENEGTVVINPVEGDSMEAPIISGVAHDRSEAKITIVDVEDRPGQAAGIFQAIADVGININMIVQNVSAASGHTDVSFTLPVEETKKATEVLQSRQEELGFVRLIVDDQVGKVSLIGAGMRTSPGVSAKFFRALAEAGINIEMISTSDIRVSVVTKSDQLDDAVSAVHSAFELDADEIEAVVYGGTGR